MWKLTGLAERTTPIYEIDTSEDVYAADTSSFVDGIVRNDQQYRVPEMDFVRDSEESGGGIASRIFQITFHFICSPVIREDSELAIDDTEFQLTSSEELCIEISAYIAWALTNAGMIFTFAWGAVLFYIAIKDW